MLRRPALLLAFVLAGAALAGAAPESPPPAPQGVAVSLEKSSTSQPKEKLPLAAPAADKIWSGLVIATNVASPKPPPPELREFAGRLKRVFGYNQFELSGSASNEIGGTAESWLVPSQSFWLGVKARPATSKEARGGYLLNVQLFQDKRPLIDTEAKLAPGSPLFIRGPEYGHGQLIIVLQVQR